MVYARTAPCRGAETAANQRGRVAAGPRRRRAFVAKAVLAPRNGRYCIVNLLGAGFGHKTS